MFKWIKKIISSPKEEEPLVIRLDVSEPVISFLKCVQKYPKRFETSEYFTSGYYLSSPSIKFYEFQAYRIWDKEVKRGWFIKGQFFCNVCTEAEEALAGNHSKRYEQATFLTDHEKAWLISEIKQVYSDRINRYNQIMNIRKERRIRDERDRLKEIYK